MGTLLYFSDRITWAKCDRYPDNLGKLVRGKAITLEMMGQLLVFEKGDFATALNCLRQSLEILQRLQSPDAEKVREAIANVQQMAGDRE